MFPMTSMMALGSSLATACREGNLLYFLAFTIRSTTTSALSSWLTYRRVGGPNVPVRVNLGYAMSTKLAAKKPNIPRGRGT